ncbi:MAG: PepSY domain-containing protein [Gammaproteobacteria bacterium]|nr:PepSY domain-containing protein [Gammaproteobacteria bacterium]
MKSRNVISQLVVASMFMLWSLIVDAQESSVGQIESMVLEFYGGEILRTDIETYNGASVYKVKLLGSDNSIRIVRVDADTGEIID